MDPKKEEPSNNIMSRERKPSLYPRSTLQFSRNTISSTLDPQFYQSKNREPLTALKLDTFSIKEGPIFKSSVPSLTLQSERGGMTDSNSFTDRLKQESNEQRHSQFRMHTHDNFIKEPTKILVSNSELSSQPKITSKEIM